MHFKFTLPSLIANCNHRLFSYLYAMNSRLNCYQHYEFHLCHSVYEQWNFNCSFFSFMSRLRHLTFLSGSGGSNILSFVCHLFHKLQSQGIHSSRTCVASTTCMASVCHAV